MSPDGDDLKPPMLTRDERGRFYELLRADLPRRTKRIEYLLIGLVATTTYRLLGGAPIPLEQAPVALFRLIFG